MDSKIRIAIIGGGIAGSTLANALIRLPHLSISVYESSPSFSERGASVVLSSNAIQALRHTLSSSYPSSSGSSGSSPSEADSLLKRAGAVTLNSTKMRIGSGPHAGEVVMDMTSASSEEGPNAEINGVGLHRASFLRELLAPLPKEVLHTNKKLTAIQQDPDGSDSPVIITFADGTSSAFDAVIGTDGIFGFCRSYVLDDPSATRYGPTPAGFWDTRALVPIDKARAVLGDDLFGKIDAQHGWIGDGAFLLYDTLENGTMVQVVISGVEPETASISLSETNGGKDKDEEKKEEEKEEEKQEEKTWTNTRKTPLTRQFLEQVALKNWLDGNPVPVAKAVVDLTMEFIPPENTVRYSQWEHKVTPTYFKRRVCIAGDAAHATTPWQASGAGQAIEDGMILGVLFSHLAEVNLTGGGRGKGIETVFRAYDAVRRPRAQRVIDSSRGTGTICCGRGPGGVEPQAIREALKDRWDFIVGLDLDEYKREAVRVMDGFFSGISSS